MISRYPSLSISTPTCSHQREATLFQGWPQLRTSGAAQEYGSAPAGPGTPPVAHHRRASHRGPVVCGCARRLRGKALGQQRVKPLFGVSRGGGCMNQSSPYEILNPPCSSLRSLVTSHALDRHGTSKGQQPGAPTNRDTIFKKIRSPHDNDIWKQTGNNQLYKIPSFINLPDSPCFSSPSVRRRCFVECIVCKGRRKRLLNELSMSMGSW